VESERSLDLSVPHHYLVSVPERAVSGTRPLLVALHGYGGDMSSMLRLAQAVAGEEVVSASLQGPHQFWFPTVDAEPRWVGFGWLTPFHPARSQERHHEFVLRVIDEAISSHCCDPDRVFLMGFSQACALNFRFAFRWPQKLRGVISVCGGLPSDLDNPDYRPFKGGIFHAAATRDQFYAIEKARAFPEVLRCYSPDVTFREYDSTHVFPRRALPDIRRWILDRC
jgi:phospholipase/carboxylesterase